MPYALTVFLSYAIRYGEVGCQAVISNWLIRETESFQPSVEHGEDAPDYETNLLPISGMLGLRRQNSFLLHRVERRICLAQESLNRIAVPRIDSNTDADG